MNNDKRRTYLPRRMVRYAGMGHQIVSTDGRYSVALTRRASCRLDGCISDISSLLSSLRCISRFQWFSGATIGSITAWWISSSEVSVKTWDSPAGLRRDAPMSRCIWFFAWSAGVLYRTLAHHKVTIVYNLAANPDQSGTEICHVLTNGFDCALLHIGM